MGAKQLGTVEVEPQQELGVTSNIGQVVLKRLISAEQAIAVLNQAESVFNSATLKQQQAS